MDQELLDKSELTVAQFCKERISASVRIIETSFAHQSSSHSSTNQHVTMSMRIPHDITVNSANFSD